MSTLITSVWRRGNARCFRRGELPEDCLVCGGTPAVDFVDYQLIEQGCLAPIRVETLPLQIDLAGVGLDSCGDIDVTQAGGVVAPYLDALAAEAAQRRDRKTLVFLPLVELSKRFAAAARAQGLPAEHIDANCVCIMRPTQSRPV